MTILFCIQFKLGLGQGAKNVSGTEQSDTKFSKHRIQHSQYLQHVPVMNQSVVGLPSVTVMQNRTVLSTKGVDFCLQHFSFD